MLGDRWLCTYFYCQCVPFLAVSLPLCCFYGDQASLLSLRKDRQCFAEGGGPPSTARAVLLLPPLGQTQGSREYVGTSCTGRALVGQDELQSLSFLNGIGPVGKSPLRARVKLARLLVWSVQQRCSCLFLPPMGQSEAAEHTLAQVVGVALAGSGHP